MRGIPVLLFALFILSGCDKQAEEKPDGRTEVEKDLTQRGGKHFKVVEVKKHDGQSSEVFGVKKYKLEFVAHVQFTEACIYRNDGGIYIETASGEKQLQKNEIKGEKGDRAMVVGELVLQLKDSGWKPESIDYKGMTYDLDSMEIKEDKTDYKYTP